jgi:hypothetical protein
MEADLRSLQHWLPHALKLLHNTQASKLRSVTRGELAQFTVLDSLRLASLTVFAMASIFEPLLIGTRAQRADVCKARCRLEAGESRVCRKLADGEIYGSCKSSCW